jgi:hypothetical protein
MVVELSGVKLPLTASTATPRHWMFPLKKASGLSGAAWVNRQPRSNPLGSDGPVRALATMRTYGHHQYSRPSGAHRGSPEETQEWSAIGPGLAEETCRPQGKFANGRVRPIARRRLQRNNVGPMNTAGLSSMCTNHTLISQHIVWAHRYPGPSPESPARRLPAEEMRNVYRLRNPKQSTYILDIFCVTSGSHNLDEATLLVGR